MGGGEFMGRSAPETDLGDYDFAILISACNSHKKLLPLCAKGYSILIAKLQKLQHIFL